MDEPIKQDNRLLQDENGLTTKVDMQFHGRDPTVS